MVWEILIFFSSNKFKKVSPLSVAGYDVVTDLYLACVVAGYDVVTGCQ